MSDDFDLEQYIKDYLAIKEATLYGLLLDSNEIGVEHKAELLRRLELSLDL